MSHGTYAELLLSETSEAQLRFWLGDLGLPQSKHPYHCTAVYSKTPLPLLAERVHPFWSQHNRTCDRTRLSFGFIGGHLVLNTPCVAAYGTFHYAKGMGATWDFPDYKPHITLVYGVTLEQLEGHSLWLPKFGITFEQPQVYSLDSQGRPERV